MKLEDHSEITEQGDGTYILTDNLQIRSDKIDQDWDNILKGNNYTISVDGYVSWVFRNMTGKILNTNFELESTSLTKENNGKIQNCTFSISYSEDADLSVFGGICGENNGVIQNCTVNGMIEKDCAGLIAGENYGRIEDCDTDGYVFGTKASGGICGRQGNGIITDCSSSATVESIKFAGGICGSQENIEESVVFKNCSFTGEIGKVKNWVSGIIVGKSFTQLLYKNCTSDSKCAGHIENVFSANMKNCDFTSELYISGFSKYIFKDGIEIEDSQFDLTLSKPYNDIQIVNNSPPSPQFKNTSVSITAIIEHDPNINDLNNLNSDLEKPLDFQLEYSTKELINKNTQKISTEKELYNCNKYDTIELQDDILITKNKTAIPILLGDFNGNGHTIKGLNKPLIHTISKTSTISDLTIEQSFVKNKFTQELLGCLARVGGGNISNITVKNSTVDSEDSKVGGLVGSTQTGDNHGEISNCSVENITVRGEEECGGVAGEISTYNDLTVKNSSISGDEKIGGIYGIGAKWCDENKTTVVKNSDINGHKHVGGIVGKDKMITSEDHSVKNTQISGISHVGGLGGSISTKILNSIVTGSLVTGQSLTGGLTGALGKGELNNCKVDSKITGNEISGLVGEINCGSVINCISVGTVVGKTVSGFVHECMDGIIKKSYCQNKLTGKNKTAIFANSVNNTTLEKCFTLSTSTTDTVAEIIYNTEQEDFSNLYWSSILHHPNKTVGTKLNSKNISEFKTILI